MELSQAYNGHFLNDKLSNLFIRIFIVLINDCMKYSGWVYLYWILNCILYSDVQYTQAHSVHRNTGRRDCPHLERRALESTVTEVPANAFTININFTNGNTLIKADFLKRSTTLK